MFIYQLTYSTYANIFFYLFISIFQNVDIGRMNRRARCSSDVTVCPGPKTRANSFDK